MRTKEIRPWLDPEACAVCGRRLLQGEALTRFITPDGEKRTVCELCVPRADRARWMRERAGEQPLAPRPTKPRRPGIVQRIGDWFAGADRSSDELDIHPADLDPEEPLPPVAVDDTPIGDRLEQRALRSRLPKIEPRGDAPPRRAVTVKPSGGQTEPRNVTAVPTDEEAKLQRGLELFNESQFPRTVAGLTRSLGLPQVAILHAGGNSVEIFVAWGISWYSYRVDLGDATEPVELSGRGNDSAELDDSVGEWNVVADAGGVLMLKPGSVGASAESDA